jgi:hypothetical protein
MRRSWLEYVIVYYTISPKLHCILELVFVKQTRGLATPIGGYKTAINFTSMESTAEMDSQGLTLNLLTLREGRGVEGKEGLNRTVIREDHRKDPQNQASPSAAQLGR